MTSAAAADVSTRPAFHHAANVFPMMSDAELTALADDIRANQLLHPIVLDRSGRVLDGRNRLLACERANVAPSFETWKGDDSAVVDFIVSQNLRRRQLSIRQRSLVAARIANLEQGQRANRCAGDADTSIEVSASLGQSTVTYVEAAKLLGVSKASVERGRAVLAHGVHELIEGVQKDAISISAAARLSKLPAAQQRERLAKGRSGAYVSRSPVDAEHRRARIRALAAEGHSSTQIAAKLGITFQTCRSILSHEHIECPGDRATGRSRHHDATRIVAAMVLDAEHLTADANLIDFHNLDHARIDEWLSSLRVSRKALSAFIARLSQEQRHAES